MKLTRCYISAFGKLKDFSFDFHERINELKKNNGWGKTTFATFIKAMFYGLNDSKKSIAENERLKYKPWNSEDKFGGYIEFSAENHNFRVERFFGTKESEDILKVFDLDTGKELNCAVEVGQKFFNIDEEGFLSTTYFGEKDFKIKSNVSITNKYNSILEMENPEEFDEALSRLEKKKKEYKIRGDKGLIFDTIREINIIQQQLKQLDSYSDTLSELKDKGKILLSVVEEDKLIISQLEDKLYRLSENVALNDKKQNFDNFVFRKKEIDKRKYEINEILNDNLTDEKEIATYMEYNNELIKIREGIQNINKDIESLKRIISHNNQPVHHTFPLISGLIGAVLMGCGIALMFVSIVAGVCLGVFGLAVITLAIFAYFKEVKDSELVKQGYKKAISQKNTDLAGYEMFYKKYATKIHEFIMKFNIASVNDIGQTLMNILKLSNEYKRLDQEERKIETQLLPFDHVKNSFSNLIANEGETVEVISEKLKLMREKFQEDNDKLSNHKSVVNKYSLSISNESELTDREQELREKLYTYQEEYNIIDKTIKYLKQADENLKIKYKSPIENSLNKYIALIDTDAKKTHINVDLQISVEENGRENKTDYYSKGYQKMFNIAKRFALIDVLFDNEKPFIILDDPFSDLDDDKLQSALDLITKLSDYYQIIYFTCNEGRRV